MKFILPTAMMLFSIAVLATGGGAQSKNTTETKKTMNSQHEMEERHNNASVIMGTGMGTAYDGKGMTEKDARPQGKKVNKDYSDKDLIED